MRIDYELIRTLLFEIEEQSDGYKNYCYVPNVDEQTPALLKREYHIRFMIESGLVSGTKSYYIDLTPEGHKTAELIRNKDQWERVKKSFTFITKETISAFLSHWMSTFF